MEWRWPDRVLQVTLENIVFIVIIYYIVIALKYNYYSRLRPICLEDLATDLRGRG